MSEPVSSVSSALPPSADDRWRPLQGFALLLLWYAFFAHNYLTANDGSRFALTAAIVEGDTLEIGTIYPRIVDASAHPVDAAIFDGRIYSDKAPLGALLAVPVYRLARRLTDRLPWLVYAVTVCCASLCGALLGLLFLLTLRDWGVTSTRALLLTLAVGFGSNLFYWSTVFFSHALTSLLLFGAWFALRRYRHRWWLIAAGAAAGAAFTSEFSALPAIAGVVVYALARHRGRALWLLAGVLPPLLMLAGYDYLLFGDPLVLPYRHQMFFADAHSTGFYGVHLPQPLELLRLLFGPQHGLLLYNPLLLAALVATPLFVKRWRSEACWVLAIAGALLLALSGMDTVRVLGRCWGPRLLLPALPFLALALAVVDGQRRWLRWTSTIAIALSVAINFAIVNASYLPHEIGWSAWGDLVRGFSGLGSGNIVVLTLQPSSRWLALATLAIPLALSALALMLPALMRRLAAIRARA